MPTETVYGLAANAFDIKAVRKIFEYKGRPLTDPLIVHVTSIEMAKELVNIDNSTFKVFEALAEKFWPGPLTIIMKANFNKLSPILTANTEFIGIRSPNNEIARKLIEYSGVPIAAPSANKFCHVSPVNPQHVWEDFKEFNVNILDGGVCNFCMESTVVKINNEQKLFQIFRVGAISKEDLESFIQNEFDSLEEIKGYTVEITKRKTLPVETDIENIEVEVQSKEDNNTFSAEAPGQFAKHYSPQLDAFIVNSDDKENKSFNFNEKEVVVIDYKETIKNKYKHNFLYSLDLSIKGDPEEVMHNLYDYLRQAEKIDSAKHIFLCDIQYHMEENPLKFTLVDRIVKAAAGKSIYI